MVTVALGMMAPVASVTVPVISPWFWAWAGADAKVKARMPSPRAKRALVIQGRERVDLK
jgi:hypothetical protein